MCFTIDHKLLFAEFDEQDIEDGFLFYTMFYNAPPAIKVSDAESVEALPCGGLESCESTF